VTLTVQPVSLNIDKDPSQWLLSVTFDLSRKSAVMGAFLSSIPGPSKYQYELGEATCIPHVQPPLRICMLMLGYHSFQKLRCPSTVDGPPTVQLSAHGGFV